MHVMTKLLAPFCRRPLLLLTLLWMGGILCSSHLPLPWLSWVIAAALFLLAWVLTQQFPGMAARAALAGAVVCLAAGMSAWQSAPTTAQSVRYLPQGGVIVQGYPLAAPTDTAMGWQVTFRVTARREGAYWRRAICDIYLIGRETPPAPGHMQQVFGKVLPADEPGNPYGLSWPAYLRERNLAYAVLAYTTSPLPAPAPTSRLLSLRGYLERRLTATMPGAYGALNAQVLGSILLGVHGAALPAQITDQFRRAGTIHLMVVSGSQVALLGGLLLFPLWLVSYGRARTTFPRVRIVLLLLSFLALGSYVALADRGPSVDRALLMCLLGMLSLFLTLSPLARRRSFRPDSLTLLAASALVLLVCRPALLFSPAMQLSYGAVLGLITVTPVCMRLLHHALGPLALLPATALGAQVMTVPILAWHFGAISLIGLFTNLLAVPLVGVLVPLGLLTLLCAAVAPPLAVLLNHLNVPLVQLLLLANTRAAGLSWAMCPWPLRSGWAVLMYYAAVCLAMVGLSRWTDRVDRDWRIPAGREPRMW